MNSQANKSTKAFDFVSGARAAIVVAIAIAVGVLLIGVSALGNGPVSAASAVQPTVSAEWTGYFPAQFVNQARNVEPQPDAF